MHLHTSGIVNVQQRGQTRNWQCYIPGMQRPHSDSTMRPKAFRGTSMQGLIDSRCTSKRELTSDMEPPQLESMMRP